MDEGELTLRQPESTQPGGPEEDAARAVEETVESAAEAVEEPAEPAAEAVEGFAAKEETAEPAQETESAAGLEEPEQTGTDVEAAGTAGGTQEAENPETRWKRRAEAYAAQAVFSEARAAAAAQGVPESRLNYAARLADTSGIDPEDDGAREKIARAVRAVLKDLPELRGGAGTGQTSGARRARRDAFEKGFLGD